MANDSEMSYLIKNKRERKLFTCGKNTYGQLGLGKMNSAVLRFEDTSVSNVEQVCSGQNHTVIKKTDGTIWSCGRNQFGQLGLGDNIDRNVFTKIDVDNVELICCGDDFTIIKKTDGTIYGCGDNNYGQLGLGDITPRNTFSKIAIDDVKCIGCGKDHTIIVKNNGDVYGSGNNTYGELGLGSGSSNYYTTFSKIDISHIVNVSLGYLHSLLLNDRGEIFTFGRNHNGELGLGHNSNINTPTKVDVDNVINIECGSYTSIIIKEDRSIWGTGYNYYGTFGTGSNGNLNKFTQIMTTLDTTNIGQMYCGMYHTIIVMKDGTVLATGYNEFGELGLGDKTNKNSFTKVDIHDIVSAGNNWNYGGGTSSMSYLVKSHDKYHTLENSQLVEITDTVTEDVINDKGVDIDTINTSKDLLPNEYSLISAVQSELELKANQLTMVAMKNEIDIDTLGKFKELTMEGNNLTDNVRVLLKVNGKNILNYKSYSTDNISWHDLLFTLEELSDIPSLNIPELDKAKKVLVAFLFKNTDLETKTLINKIVMKYDKSGDIISINDENVRYSEGGLKIEFTNNVNKALVDVVKTIK